MAEIGRLVTKVSGLSAIRTIPLSFSALNTFNTCPKQFEHLYILRDVKSLSGEAALWGTLVHKQIEEYLQHGVERTDPAALRADAVIKGVRAKGIKQQAVEWEWGLDKDFAPTHFKHKDARLRGIIDWIAVLEDTAFICDWKTGKVKDDMSQLEVFALAAFQHFPDLQRIRTMFVWLKSGENRPTVRDFSRNEVENLKEIWSEKMQLVYDRLEYGEFPMRKSGLCRGWCPVESCVYWTPRHG